MSDSPHGAAAKRGWKLRDRCDASWMRADDTSPRGIDHTSPQGSGR